MAERGAQSAERTELRCRPVGEMRDGERAGEPSADDQRIAVLDQYVSGVCDQRTPGPQGKRLVAAEAPCAAACEQGAEPGPDRKSVGEGKGGCVRVDPGWGRIVKKKKAK